MQKLGDTYLQIFKRDKNVLQCTKDYKYTYTQTVYKLPVFKAQ